MTDKHSKALVISEWTQIIASFGHFQEKSSPVDIKRIEASIIVNGEEENQILSYNYNDVSILTDTRIETFIGGGTDSDSFKGSIGLIEIFTPGGFVQTSKSHLVIHFNFSF